MRKNNNLIFLLMKDFFESLLDQSKEQKDFNGQLNSEIFEEKESRQ